MIHVLSGPGVVNSMSWIAGPDHIWQVDDANEDDAIWMFEVRHGDPCHRRCRVLLRLVPSMSQDRMVGDNDV